MPPLAEKESLANPQVQSRKLAFRPHTFPKAQQQTASRHSLPVPMQRSPDPYLRHDEAKELLSKFLSGGRKSVDDRTDSKNTLIKPAQREPLPLSFRSIDGQRLIKNRRPLSNSHEQTPKPAQGLTVAPNRIRTQDFNEADNFLPTPKPRPSAPRMESPTGAHRLQSTLPGSDPRSCNSPMAHKNLKRTLMGIGFSVEQSVEVLHYCGPGRDHEVEDHTKGTIIDPDLDELGKYAAYLCSSSAYTIPIQRESQNDHNVDDHTSHTSLTTSVSIMRSELKHTSQLDPKVRVSTHNNRHSTTSQSLTSGQAQNLPRESRPGSRLGLHTPPPPPNRASAVIDDKIYLPEKSLSGPSLPTASMPAHRHSFDHASLSTGDSRGRMKKRKKKKKRTPEAPLRVHSSSTSALLRSRESGEKFVMKNHTAVTSSLFGSTTDALVPWKTWNGASNDVTFVAWSPDGTMYSAGAVAETDAHSMQYNKGNNLILGNLPTNSLKELGDHYVDRPRPETISAGPNSLEATYVTADPKLYMSITEIQWSPQGNRLFTSSYDKTVKIWDVTKFTGAKCIGTLRHDAPVEVMALSSRYSDMLATGTPLGDRSLRVYPLQNDSYSGRPTYTQVPLKAPKGKGTFPFTPASFQWGTIAATGGYLVAGFSSKESDQNGDPAKEGHLGLFNFDEGRVEEMKVQPYAQNVFHATWAPAAPYFATATTAKDKRKHNTVRSHVRVYDAFNLPTKITEYDCPALDINAVSFCPTNTSYIAASCTNGMTFVWDSRKPDMILHTLKHGKPVRELRHDLSREQADVGVTTLLWGSGSDELFTGGSDGYLKSWNILLSPETTHRKDVATFDSEVMSGSFSPDMTNLLLGDGKGAIHLLSTAPFERQTEIGGKGIIAEIEFECPPLSTDHELTMGDGLDDPDYIARRAAEALLVSEELELRQYYMPVKSKEAKPKLGWGPSKGTRYTGPYHRCFRERQGTQSTIPDHALASAPLLPEFASLQLDQTNWGHKRRNEAAREGTDKAKLRLTDRPNKAFGSSHVRSKISGMSRSHSVQQQSLSSATPRAPVIIDLLNSEDDAPMAKKMARTNRPNSMRKGARPDPEAEIVDLTISDDDDYASIPSGQPLRKSEKDVATLDGTFPQRGRSISWKEEERRSAGRSLFGETLAERLEDDHWYPPHSLVDANLGEERSKDA